MDEFLKRGCCCASKCYQLFDREEYKKRRDEANSMSRDELDMLVLANIMALASVDNVVGPSHKHTPRQRQRVKVPFYHLGKRICRDTYLAMHAIDKVA